MEIVTYIGEADGKRALVTALGLENLEVRREEYAAMSGLGHSDPLIVELYIRKLPTSHLSDREISGAIKRIVADVGTRFPESSITSRPLTSDIS